MRKMMIIILVIIMVLLFIMGGCAGNLPQSERSYFLQDNWGMSHETVKYNQTLDPEAGLKPAIVKGHDGRSTNMSVDKYRKTFEERVDPGDQIMQEFRVGN